MFCLRLYDVYACVVFMNVWLFNLDDVYVCMMFMYVCVCFMFVWRVGL